MIPMLRGFALVLVGHAAAEDVDIVISTATPSFTLRGERTGEVNYFKGIPFSKPRTPPNRFQLPEDYEHSAGEIYMAKDPKDQCVQGSGVGSEDCLYLDIYMPEGAEAPGAGVKPVLVWIHGGAWMTGSKNDFSGVLWASQQWADDVDRAVTVTVNYRMNILGFPDMDGTPKNLGMHDNIQALRWVNSHISNFGGDTSSITIFGVSAGAMQVVQLWSSPAARGLFNRAIAQSPFIWYYPDGSSYPSATFHAWKRAEQASCASGAMALACADLPPGDGSCTLQSPTLAHMRTAGCFGGLPRWYGPMSEDGLISDTFLKDWCGHKDVGYGVPLLAGHNSLEINLWTLYGMLAEKEALMRNWTNALAPMSNGTAVFQCLGDLYEASGRMQDPAYPPYMGNLTEQGARDVYATSGVFFNIISQTLAQLPNVHMYLFNDTANHLGDLTGAANLGLFYCSRPIGANGCEDPFVITDVGMYNATNENVGSGGPMNEVVQRNMRKVWASFAKSGDPGWAHDEVGVFMDGRVVIRENSAAFSSSASTMLTSLMCHPATVMKACAASRTYTCGEVRRLAKQNGCCGDPSKTFRF